MEIEPKVAIILVNYNGYKDTIECLQSLRSIEYKNYEVIVVDNASTNESVKEIKSFISGNERLIESNANDGFSSGNNIGIRYALNNGADYCLLLNNDTIVEPDFLNKLVDAFNNSEYCGLTIGKILYEGQRNLIWYAGGSISERTAKTVHWHYKETDQETTKEIAQVTFATGCCMCISKKVIDQVGYLDEEYFLYEEDVDYCCRIKKAGFDIIYVPDSRIYHKVSSSSNEISVSTQYYIIRNKLIMINKHYRGFNKISAMLFCTAQFVYRCIKGELQFGLMRKAYIAYLQHETGRRLS